MERTIRKINAKKPKIPKRERVAAYARVSTASDEQKRCSTRYPRR